MSCIIPIHALPEEILNKHIFDLGDWLQGVLSLRGEESMKRLEILLPQIKKTAKGISITEIKTAFELYLDNKLTLEPRDNYLTLILFNKVIKEYKDRLPKRIIKPIEVSEEENKKEAEYNYAFMEDAVKRAKKIYKDNGFIDKYFQGQYNWLEENGFLKELADKVKWDIFKKEKPKYIEKLKFIVPLSREENTIIKKEIEHLESEEKSISTDLKIICKRELLKMYYENNI
jgi:hypothetical protein